MNKIVWFLPPIIFEVHIELAELIPYSLSLIIAAGTVWAAIAARKSASASKESAQIMRESHEAQLRAQHPVFWQSNIKLINGNVSIELTVFGGRPADKFTGDVVVLQHNNGEFKEIGTHYWDLNTLVVPGQNIVWTVDPKLPGDAKSSAIDEDINDMYGTFYLIYQIQFFDYGGLKKPLQQRFYQAIETTFSQGIRFRTVEEKEEIKIKVFIENDKDRFPPIVYPNT